MRAGDPAPHGRLLAEQKARVVVSEPKVAAKEEVVAMIGVLSGVCGRRRNGSANEPGKLLKDKPLKSSRLMGTGGSTAAEHWMRRSSVC